MVYSILLMSVGVGDDFVSGHELDAQSASASSASKLNWKSKPLVQEMLRLTEDENPFECSHRRDGSAAARWKNICSALIQKKLIPDDKKGVHIQQKVSRILKDYAAHVDASSSAKERSKFNFFNGEFDSILENLLAV